MWFLDWFLYPYVMAVLLHEQAQALVPCSHVPVMSADQWRSSQCLDMAWSAAWVRKTHWVRYEHECVLSNPLKNAKKSTGGTAIKPPQIIKISLFYTFSSFQLLFFSLHICKCANSGFHGSYIFRYCRQFILKRWYRKFDHVFSVCYWSSGARICL